MRLKIFSCHHLPAEPSISTEIFQTMVSGHPADVDATFWTDLGGRNIATRQKFCEMRHQYYVWQNLLSQYDYVGFEHYRRPFFLDMLPYDALLADYPAVARMRSTFSADRGLHELRITRAELAEYNLLRGQLDAVQREALRDYVKSYDVLFTYPIVMDVNRSFMENHANAREHWLSFARMTRSLVPRLPIDEAGLAAGWSGYLNMYIMTADLFAEYMEFVFPTLLELDDLDPHAPMRIWGHLTERTFGPFLRNKLLERPMLRTGSIPFLFQEKPE